MGRLWEKLNNTYVGDTNITWGWLIVYGMTMCVSIPLGVKWSNYLIDKRIEKKLGEKGS